MAHRVESRNYKSWKHALACSLITLLSVLLISTGQEAFKVSGGLILFAALVSAVWFAHDAEFAEISLALGSALASLVLVALALAVAHRLNSMSIAMALATLTLVVSWASALHKRSPGQPRATSFRSPYLWVILGMAIMGASAVFAVRYSSDSAVADADRALSTAVWAYQSGGQLHIGAVVPPGHGIVTLQVDVTQGRRIVAIWNHIQVASGRTWHVQSLIVRGASAIKVVIRSNGQIIAALPIRSQG